MIAGGPPLRLAYCIIYDLFSISHSHASEADRIPEYISVHGVSGAERNQYQVPLRDRSDSLLKMVRPVH